MKTLITVIYFWNVSTHQFGHLRYRASTSREYKIKVHTLASIPYSKLYLWNVWKYGHTLMQHEIYWKTEWHVG